jgi:hypothetical protein
MATKKRDAIERRVTARKAHGDDAYSWAVFVDGKEVYNGLSKSEVPYYKAEAVKHGWRRRDGRPRDPSQRVGAYSG